MSTGESQGPQQEEGDEEDEDEGQKFEFDGSEEEAPGEESCEKKMESNLHAGPSITSAEFSGEPTAGLTEALTQDVSSGDVSTPSAG